MKNTLQDFNYKNSLKTITLAVFFYFLLVIFFVSLGDRAGISEFSSFFLTIILEILVFVPLYNLLARRHRVYTLTFRFNRISNAVLLWIPVIAFEYVYSFIISRFGISIFDAQEQIIKIADSNFERILLFLAVGLIAPFVEELFFRGTLYPVLKNGLGSFKAALISSLIFGAGHGLVLFLPMFIYGLLLCYLVEERNSLDAALIIHILNNILALVISLHSFA